MEAYFLDRSQLARRHMVVTLLRTLSAPRTPALLAAAVVGLLGAVACEAGPSGVTAQADGGAPCTAGDSRPCGVELGNDGTMITCGQGAQSCVSGKWTGCLVDGELGTRQVPLPPVARAASGHLGLMTVGGTAASCENSPCDPSCMRFIDLPDSPYQSPSSTTTTVLITNGGILSQSNIPKAFQTMGSDPSRVCTPGCTSDECKAACQYDQRCSSAVKDRCQPSEPGEKDWCTGTDVTVGVGCGSDDGTKRYLFVCNRGTDEAPAGIACWFFPGNSQQMPSTTPDMKSATLVATTADPIKPGTCLQIEAVGGNNGAQEVICNVPGAAQTLPFTTGPNLATTNGYAGSAMWQSPSAAYAVGAPTARAGVQDPTGATSGPVGPTANGSVGTDGTWAQVQAGYTDDGAYASATPAAGQASSVAYRGFGLGNLVPTGATITKLVIETKWKVSSALAGTQLSIGGYVDGVLVPTAQYVDVSSPTSPTVRTITVTTPALTGSELVDSRFDVRVRASRVGVVSTAAWLAAVDYVKVTASWKATAGSATYVTSYGGFSFSIPSGATITKVTTEVSWRTPEGTAPPLLGLQGYRGATALGTEVTQATGSPGLVTSTQVLSGAALGGLTPADLNGSGFSVRVRASR